MENAYIGHEANPENGSEYSATSQWNVLECLRPVGDDPSGDRTRTTHGQELNTLVATARDLGRPAGCAGDRNSEICCAARVNGRAG